MRILQIIPCFQRRGAEVFASGLFRELTDRGVDAMLAALSPSEDRLGVSGLSRVTSMRPHGGFPGRVHELRKIIRDFRPDIIFAHGGLPFKYAVFARGFRKRPFIAYQKIGLSEQWLGRMRVLKLPFQQWIMGKADVLIPVGEATRQELTGLFRADPARIRVIGSGIPAQNFLAPRKNRGQMRSELAVPADAPLLFSAGAHSWEKNQAAMLRCLKTVKNEFPAAVLLLAGEGPERPALEKMASDLGIAKSVFFLGSRQDMAELFAASDLFLLTSLTEGVPVVLIEAGMSGIPAVTWDVAGAGEVVQHGTTGLVTPSNDEAAFARSVLQLLRDPGMAARMGKTAQAFCKERFDMKECAGRLLQLFDTMLEQRNPGKAVPGR